MPSLQSSQKNYAKGLLSGGGLQSQPGYQQALSQILSMISGNQEDYDTFAAPYMQQFNEEIIPGIAERFGGMGTGAGASSSSALYNSLAQAGKGLQTNLAAQYQGNKNLAMQQLLQYLQAPEQSKQGALNYQPQQKQKSNLWGSVGGLAGGLAGSFLGPLGTAGGTALGNALFGQIG